MHALLSASSTLTSATWQTLLSTSVLVVLLAIGVGLPVVVHAFHRQAIQTANEQSLVLARRWGNVMLGVAGASLVSGLAVIAHLRALWPGLGERFGGVVHVPMIVGILALAVQMFLVSVYVGGFQRFSPRVHASLLWPTGIAACAAMGSAVALNVWLSTAHEAASGEPGPAALLSSAMAPRVGHAVAAGVMTSGLIVASVHAMGLRQGAHLVRNSIAFRTGLGIGSVAALVQAALGLLSSSFDDGGSSTSAMVDVSFWSMVTVGAVFAAFAVLFWWGEWTGRSPAGSGEVLAAVSRFGAASVIAVVAGWLASVLSRGPWLVERVLLSADAVTRHGGEWFGLVASVGALVIPVRIVTSVGRTRD